MRLSSQTRMHATIVSLLVMALMVAGCGAAAMGKGGSTVAFDSPDLKAPDTIKVSSSSFLGGGAIPLQFTSYGQSLTPNLSWSSPPEGTKSIVLLAEDPDAHGAQPYVHWLLTNIPPTAKDASGGGTPGRNSSGTTAYYGPKPPDDILHHYWFQVYALDETLPADANDRDSVVAAMKSHVLAKGELLGTMTKP